MHEVRHGLACLLLAAMFPASAWALNKCTASDGKVTYTDAACPPQDNAKQIDIVVTPPSDIRQTQAVNAKVNDALKAIEDSKRTRAEQGGSIKSLEKPSEKAPSTATPPDTPVDDDTRRRTTPRN
jgi:hypothetical protein